MGIKKKRKVEEASNNVVPIDINTVSSNDSILTADDSQSVRTLSARLVRKKPKTTN